MNEINFFLFPFAFPLFVYEWSSCIDFFFMVSESWASYWEDSYFFSYHILSFSWNYSTHIFFFTELGIFLVQTSCFFNGPKNLSKWSTFHQGFRQFDYFAHSYQISWIRKLQFVKSINKNYPLRQENMNLSLEFAAKTYIGRNLIHNRKHQCNCIFLDYEYSKWESTLGNCICYECLCGLEGS